MKNIMWCTKLPNVVLSPFDVTIKGVNPTRDPELVESDQSWLEVSLDGRRLVEFWLDD